MTEAEPIKGIIECYTLYLRHLHLILHPNNKVIYENKVVRGSRRDAFLQRSPLNDVHVQEEEVTISFCFMEESPTHSSRHSVGYLVVR
jgi:hypothetical protein